MCYSLHDGLEGVLWRAKNRASGEWLRLPLASLLWTFMSKHLSCVERAYGGAFDLRIAIPSHPDARGGVDHLQSVIDLVEDFDSEWNTGALVKSNSSKAGARRSRIEADLFVADPMVSGKRILLFDDTFTTGGTMASAAHALKRGGARSVIGMAFGRQLKADWPDSQEFVEFLSGRELNLEQCVVHSESKTHQVNPFFGSPR
ncbi:hypothetical protein DEH18_00660 [Streptomyces sp. NHF165]|nr:hypothetical protein DEH18_00660 [Streptomyces sp. NHF165]